MSVHRTSRQPCRVLVANLYFPTNTGDLLIVKGTLGLLRGLWRDASFCGMTTFRVGSLRFLGDGFDRYEAYFGDIVGNPSDVILSPQEISHLSTPQQVAHYALAVVRDGFRLATFWALRFSSIRTHSPIDPKTFDLVLFLGGGYLQASGRFYPNLPGHLFLAYLCRLLGVEYCFLGVSISGSGRILPRTLLKAAFSGSSFVAFRDPVSYQEAIANRLGAEGGPNLVWLPDLAVGLAPIYKHHRRLRQKHAEPVIGIAFRRWRSNLGRGRGADPTGIMARALSRIARESPVRLILIPFSSMPHSPAEDDVVACLRLKESLLALSPSLKVDLRVPSSGPDLSGFEKAFDDVDLAICIRMHAAIFSAMLGIPSVTIEYEGRKSRGVCSYLGLSDYYVENLDEEQIVAKTLVLLENFDSASRIVSERVDASYEQLRTTLGQLLRSDTRGDGDQIGPASTSS